MISNVKTESLLTAQDVAEKLSLSKRAVFRLKSAGLICPCIKVGIGSIRWRESDIDHWIKLGCCAAKEFIARKESEKC
jgi:predicted DNA-binding transcriptional regulator AlpA